MKEKTTWNGTYRGINFEIQNFDLHKEKDAWCYYIYIHLDRVADKDIAESFWLAPQKDKRWKRTHYSYMSNPILSDLDWHHGITYYSKVSGFDGTNRVIKVGCDYQHYWDEGHYKSEEFLEQDAKATIDTLLQKVDMFMYCSGNGKLYKPDQGVINHHGNFNSWEYWHGTKWFDELWYKELNV